MYSKVTLARALKGDDKSRLKQLFEMQRNGFFLISFFNCKGFSLFFNRWLFILLLSVFQTTGHW